MRLAFVDLVFSWPANGGADVDLYETMRHLQAEGHEVHLFGTALRDSWERGDFVPDELPFPATRFEFGFWFFTPARICPVIRQAVDAWKPDVVFVNFGLFLKPYVTLALAHYPVVNRYYSYELAHGPDQKLYDPTGARQINLLREPARCRRLTLAAQRDRICNWRPDFWTHEYLAARAFMPRYPKIVTESFKRLGAAIVSNAIMEDHLAGLVSHIVTMPGGVNVEDYPFEPAPAKAFGGRKIILMTGRAEDPVKGVDVLHRAGALLAERRSDFEIRVTGGDFTRDTEWFKGIGWHSADEMIQLYRECDVCVVPSVWEEPFGLVAVEAMAAGRPVIASRVGGLQDIVQHDQTGLLVDPGDPAQLADHLDRLLDDPELRRRMGAAGRERVEATYDWRRIIRNYYPPLLERLTA